GRTTNPESGGKPLASRIVETPRANDSTRAQAMVADLLAQADKSSRTKLEALAPAGSQARALLEGVADNSPFLWNIAKSDPPAFARLLESEPEKRLEELTSGTAEALRLAADEQAAMSALRKMRSEAALLIALADVGGVWPLAKVTHAL